MAGRIKLPDPSLNHMFNALSIGLQYTVSFQLTHFSLKCLMLKEGWAVKVAYQFPIWELVAYKTGCLLKKCAPLKTLCLS